jgi:hypothetical protein
MTSIQERVKFFQSDGTNVLHHLRTKEKQRSVGMSNCALLLLCAEMIIHPAVVERRMPRVQVRNVPE